MHWLTQWQWSAKIFLPLAQEENRPLAKLPCIYCSSRRWTDMFDSIEVYHQKRPTKTWWTEEHPRIAMLIHYLTRSEKSLCCRGYGGRKVSTCLIFKACSIERIQMSIIDGQWNTCQTGKTHSSIDATKVCVIPILKWIASSTRIRRSRDRWITLALKSLPSRSIE